VSVLKLDLPPTALLESLLDLDQAILDALPLGVYACDAQGRILRVNRRAVELWGRAPKLMDSTQRFCGCHRLESLDGDVIAPHQTPIARAALFGERFDGVEAMVENPNGARWVARVNVAPLTDANGVLVGAINCFQDVTVEHALRRETERQQRTFDLAMIASKMGTWRYTIADNICVYDHNAQQLYGLSEARFLHDEEGVKDKFHPDDMAIMWERVAKALDPLGDGRYDVEYRVKQTDGSWRWLSAWGLVEFDGAGPDRKPVAIAGASRDLNEMKRAEELQRLLLNELNHRVKNTLATVQSLVAQTLRGADDMGVARTAITARILSLANAHDLLTARSWSGADIALVVGRAVAPFTADRFDIDGPSLDLSPKQTLALSLALHELATNAVKHGALSGTEGRVSLTWSAGDGALRLAWRETGGPAVAPPTRRGFGTRLLVDGLSRDLGGTTTLTFGPDGVCFEITAALGETDADDAIGWRGADDPATSPAPA
jgi:two-component sensor histidine kinase